MSHYLEELRNLETPYTHSINPDVLHWFHELLQESLDVSGPGPVPGQGLGPGQASYRTVREDHVHPGRRRSDTSTDPSFAQLSTLQHLHESFQSYHNNIVMYQSNISSFIQRLNVQRSQRLQENVLDDLIYPYHRTIQDYNHVMRSGLSTLNHLIDPRGPIGSFDTPIPIPVHQPLRTSTGQHVHGLGHALSRFSPNTHILAEIPIPVIGQFQMTANHRPPASNRTFTALTQDQLRNTTHNYLFATETNTLEQTQCPISLENYQPGDVLTQIRHCGHTFLAAPLQRWFVQNTHCPLCRHNLLDVSGASTTDISGADTLLPVPFQAGSSEPEARRPVASPQLRQVLDTLAQLSPTLRSRLGSEPSAAEPSATDHSIAELISTLLSRNPSLGFSNMDLDITYSVEYDTSGASV